jgi:hypothetical protein
MPDKHTDDTPFTAEKWEVESVIHNVINKDARIGLLVD